MRAKDGIFCFAHLRWCHNRWASNILIMVTWTLSSTTQNMTPSKMGKTKYLIFYSLNLFNILENFGKSSVAYPGGCIACACSPGGLRGAPKRRGEKERSKERERKKGKEKGRQRRREGKGKKICKRKGKVGRNQKKKGYKKKNTRGSDP